MDGQETKLKFPCASESTGHTEMNFQHKTVSSFVEAVLFFPTALRTEMIIRAYASHMGMQYTTNTARDIMYWPRMHTELVEAVQRCTISQESQPALPKEPPHDTPTTQNTLAVSRK